jgi:hypothetical protein
VHGYLAVSSPTERDVQDLREGSRLSQESHQYKYVVVVSWAIHRDFRDPLFNSADSGIQKRYHFIFRIHGEAN